MAGRSVRVVVSADAEADAEEVAQLVERLRAEVVEHEFDTVADPAAPAVPRAAKTGDPAGVGSLLIALVGSGGVLTGLVGVLQGWLARSQARRLVVEIDGDRLELDDPTSEERRRLTDAWLSRHEPPPGGGGPGGVATG